MFAEAQQTKKAEGADSCAYPIELVAILEKMQTDPQHRADVTAASGYRPSASRAAPTAKATLIKVCLAG